MTKHARTILLFEEDFDVEIIFIVYDLLKTVAVDLCPSCRAVVPQTKTTSVYVLPWQPQVVAAVAHGRITLRLVHHVPGAIRVCSAYRRHSVLVLCDTAGAPCALTNHTQLVLAACDS